MHIGLAHELHTHLSAEEEEDAQALVVADYVSRLFKCGLGDIIEDLDRSTLLRLREKLVHAEELIKGGGVVEKVNGHKV